MAILKISSRRQVTFSKNLLLHLGAQPGTMIEISKQPDGKATIQAIVDDTSSIKNVFGILSSYNTHKIKLSVEKMNEISQRSWNKNKY